ncbi:flagellar motor switch phosphatase FliY [uncultured Clostridium sp.]|uniref:flagellar motor switch phosphatase FliY n=1 Tax=uncultured Clostridium sp. TaxID=59620 RepID=UPI00261961DD|nr:flagellar motor switch phosphatase FliY [uncultured Clostridium sp.]
MADGFLSQEEIDALLNGDNGNDNSSNNSNSVSIEFTDQDNDLLGEIGNISMGSASTALSQVINQSVNITTPVVEVTTIGELKDRFEVPNILLEVEYTSGIVGKNILIMKITDAAVIANLMMGGDGSIEPNVRLSEIEVSAVQEAMNQMIGSAATSMATMFSREVNISPPNSKIWENTNEKISDSLDDTEKIINIEFHLKIGELVDSTIMQVLPVNTARKIIGIMMGEEEESEEVEEDKSSDDFNLDLGQTQEQEYAKAVLEKEIVKEEAYSEPVSVNRASFENLDTTKNTHSYNNIDLIMDVPLDISVVLGRTKKSIKDVLNLGVGSVIELNKLADEPLEILVNGKKIADGEVVVIDENFGIRITNIATSAERINSLK